MKTIKYTNFIFMKMFWLCLPVCVLMVIAEVASFGNVLKSVRFDKEPFIRVIDMSNLPMIFIVAVMLCLCVIPITFFRFYYGNKSIYTLVQAQPTKNTLYHSFLISGIMMLLMLWLSQMIGISMCYNQYTVEFTKFGTIIGISLFESVLEMDFLRFFFPFCLSEWCKLIFIIVSTVLAVIYVIESILSVMYIKLSIILIWGTVEMYYLNNFKLGSKDSLFWICAIATIVICVYFYTDGKKGISNKSIL